MIRFEQVTFSYPGVARPVLAGVDLTIPEGELCLVVGRTGSGKSTLLRAVNGLVPHFSGGTLTGRVSVDGRDTRDHPPRELADVVGYVGQDPDAGFVTDTVEDELAYAMENLGLDPATMRRRVEDVLDLLGLADLRQRALQTLSAGQQQRVALGSVLTAHPQVLVLDEPTSALDPPAAEDVLAALHRLVHDLGLTVLLAEHRLERVVQYADRVVVVPGDGTVSAGAPADVLATAPVAPAVVRLGRLAGWTPLPLSVRDARRAAASLRLAPPVPDAPPVPGEVVGSTSRLTARYGDLAAVRDVTLDVRAGEVVALMGRNGAGKTTLLSHLVGLRKPSGGAVTVRGVAPHAVPSRRLARLVGLVPQDPGRLLYADSVAAECRQADREAELPDGTTAAVLASIAPDLPPDRHPSDLSEGQRLALALAVVLGAEPPLVLLDEPTRGLDYAAKTRLVPVLRSLAARGHAVVLSTHDVELAAEVADRTVVLADGEVVADGPTREVVRQSPAFAPQVTKVLGGGWLTVAEVERALA
ncbi:MAG TPA: ATP-binding cassette domain-containing protein [Frankiaceae bacterium]|nr:ATP-binding cassette domain-containing protein [Frankiaceae bacterium]